MWLYLDALKTHRSAAEIHGAVKNVSPKGGEMLMTIAEKLRNEGKKEGLEEGMEKGLEMTLTALQAFREGKDLEEVMNLTGLERDILLKIQIQAFK
jgi:predicted transposase YdaD